MATVRKVLHVIPSVAMRRGGPSIVIRALAQNLVKAGVETHIATTDDDGPGRLQVPHGRPVMEQGVVYWYFRRQTRFYTFSWPLSTWLARHIPDYQLVHIHALFSYAALPAAYWAKRYRVPYIVRPLGTLNRWGMEQRRRWLKKLSYHMIESRILREAALIHYTSEQERLEAQALQVQAASVVIPNALPDGPVASAGGQFRARHPSLDGRSTILFLSRVDPKKGLDLLLPAFAEVRRQLPAVALVLAGSGDSGFVAELHTAARRLGIAGDVIWAGLLVGHEKSAALADADVFVLPSYSENFGIAVLEAMAAGVPVVISDQVAIHREVAGAQAGLVVACDAGEVSQALLRLLTNASLRAAMGRNGKSLSQQQYSLNSVTEKLVSTYEAIVR